MSSTFEHMIHGVRVIGIDLSGPANTKETALLWGHAQGAAFAYNGHRVGADDEAILSVAQQQAALGPVCVGLDAPLSYQPGGGMRAGDTALHPKSGGRLISVILSPKYPT
jgi:hypothetical protein